MLLALFSALSFLLAESKTEININNSVNSVENKVSVSTNSNGSSVVKINNNSFEIEGTIDSVTSDKFSVDTQSISKSENIGGANNIKIGNIVKVKGTIKNSILYAENISLISGNKSSNNEIKIEISPKPSSSKSTSISPKPTISISPTPITKTDNQVSNNIFTSLFKTLLNIFENIFK